MSVTWTQTAADQLQAIRDYLARSSPAYAQALAGNEGEPMSYLRVSPVLSWVLALATAASAGQAETPPGKAKPSATPEEAVKHYVAAVRANDVEQLLAVLADGPRKQLKEIQALQERMARLWAARDAALDAQFGKAAKPQPRPIPRVGPQGPAGDQAFDVEILSKDAKGDDQVALKARVTTRGNEQTIRTITAVKEGGHWKLVLLEAGHSELIRQQLDLAHTLFKASTEQFVKDVKAGKYKSREEAEKALRESPPVELKGNKDFVLPGPKGPPPAK